MDCAEHTDCFAFNFNVLHFMLSVNSPKSCRERAHLIRTELCNSNEIECTKLLFQSKLCKQV